MISVRQINQQELTDFVALASSGTAFQDNITAYTNQSGYLGGNVLYTSGGLQTVTGSKRFLDPLLVNYSGGTGAAPSSRWVNDQIANASLSLSGFILGISGALTGSQTVGVGTGYSGFVENTFVHRTNVDETISGIKTFVGTELNITGDINVNNASFAWLQGDLEVDGSLFAEDIYAAISSTVKFHDQAKFDNSPFVPNTPTAISGAINLFYLSGVSGVLAAGGGGGSPNSVTTTGNEIIGGFKQFTGSPFVPAPTQPSGVANLSWVSGVSGDLYARMTGISGAIGGGSSITNNYYITGTGTINNTYNSSGGAITNTFVSQNIFTGNVINMSLWFDQYNLATGLNQIEAFVSRDFVFTGYALGVINTGTQGYFSGSLYQRTPLNTKTNFVNFSLNNGMVYSGAAGYAQTVSGQNRVGLDIYLIGTGITGLSVGIYGTGM